MTRDGTAPAGAVLESMSAALAHRGPDGQGSHIAGDTGLVHRRLAIIDLETGDQPLADGGGCVLVANGEIYNHVELRAALGDVSFRTRSDCEPPLWRYRRDGVLFADALRGMYAIAIHDTSENRLVLARDPFGIKPLYYVETPRGFAFASDIRAFAAAGLIAPRVVPSRRRELLELQFTTGRETIFEGVQRVLPGETIIVSGGRVIERHQRAALPAGAPRAWEEDEALAALDVVLSESVRIHERADVPYGLFLSGGIDSAALLALMARLDGERVHAFTAGFDVPGIADERAHARALARKVGAKHTEVGFSEADFWTYLPRVAAAMDDPAADYATLPTFKLAEVAAQELKVVLCGEGGDELFGGYGRYRSLMRPFWLGGRRLRARGTFDGLGVLRDSGEGWRDGIAAREILEASGGRTRLQVGQAVDCADWLPNDLLTKLDRCLMAHGLEGRTPFLDPEVAAFAFRLPNRLKVRHGLGKWLLRKWLAANLPEAEPLSPKRGFTVPVAAWIRTRGRALGELVARQPAIEEIARPGAVRALFAADGKRQGFAIWTLLYYALWHRCHIEGRSPGPDVFESLADRA